MGSRLSASSPERNHIPLPSATGIADGLEAQKLSEEIAKLKNENAKLVEDIAEARWNKHTGRYISLAAPVVTALLTLLGIYFGAIQFRASLSNSQDALTQNQNLKNQDLAHDRKAKQQEREHDFLKSFSAYQTTTYFVLCQNVATIAALSETDSRSLTAQLKFIQLYRGDAQIVGDEPVADAMDNFYDCLHRRDVICFDSKNQPGELQKRSRALADACRASMARTSETDITQINQFQDLFQRHKAKLVVGP